MKRQTAFVAMALLSLLLTITFPASASGQGRSGRAAGTTTLVSVASDGTQGNDASVEPSISATGRFVAFTSFATNLVSGDTNDTGDIFIHDRQSVGSVEEPLPAELEEGDY
jgi:hypothetical protein